MANQPQIINYEYYTISCVSHRAARITMQFQLNTPFLLGYSFVLLIASVIGTGFICAQWGWYPRYGVPNVFPTCLVLIYALGPLLDNTFQLRDKVNYPS